MSRLADPLPLLLVGVFVAWNAILFRHSEVDRTRCARDLNDARRMSEHVAGQYRFVGIALTDFGLEEYVVRHSLRWEIVTSVPQAIIDAYGIGAAPLTIVSDGGGRVAHVWSGASKLPDRQ